MRERTLFAAVLLACLNAPVLHTQPPGAAGARLEGDWVRIDPENLGTDVVQSPHDLARGQFLTGGEGWECIRSGTADPMHL